VHQDAERERDDRGQFTDTAAQSAANKSQGNESGLHGDLFFFDPST
jgi:hypothetical protein